MGKKKIVQPHELRKIIRRAILASGKTIYEFHKLTGIDQGQLHRFMNDESTDMRASNAEKLCECLGLRIEVAE